MRESGYSLSPLYLKPLLIVGKFVRVSVRVSVALQYLASLGVDVQTGLRLTVDYFFDLRLTVDFGFGLSTDCRLLF